MSVSYTHLPGGGLPDAEGAFPQQQDGQSQQAAHHSGQGGAQGCACLLYTSVSLPVCAAVAAAGALLGTLGMTDYYGAGVRCV